MTRLPIGQVRSAQSRESARQACTYIAHVALVILFIMRARLYFLHQVLWDRGVKFLIEIEGILLQLITVQLHVKVSTAVYWQHSQLLTDYTP